MIILGIDTALRCTGYGVVDLQGRHYRALDCGVIRNPREVALSECLRRLAGGVRQLLTRYRPEIGVIEGGFFSRNVRTAVVLGMARGVVVGLLAEHGVPVYEYAPRKAKQVVVGYGGADKQQVAAVMAKMLSLSVAEIPDDATDALAMAVCHGLTAQTLHGLHLPAPL